MPGRGPVPKPKEQRMGAHDPQRGDWVAAPGVGWQFGDPPLPPEGLSAAGLEAWDAWFGAWFAAFWAPDDLPALRQLVRLYDQVEAGAFQRHGELRMSMDTYGITPKGQQDRRWLKPKEEISESKVLSGRWADLRVVDAVPPKV